MISGLAEHRLRRLPWVLAACLSLSPVTATFAQDRSEEPDREPGGMTREIIDTIEDFESQRDAKCYATATRLENFIFGTPLSEETRFLKIDLQKTIIDRVWRQASDRAAGRDAGQVTLNDVEPFLRQIVSYQKDDEENIRVDLPTQTLDLSARDFRHYSSIAYALRAILAVAQDQRWSGDEPPLQLDERAVDALRETLDVLTLAVLALADREARVNNEAEITPFRFLGAWDRIVSSAGDPPASAAAPAPFDPQGARPFLTFKAIVDQKISSYEKYNRIDGGDRTELFLANVRRYYARYHVPPGGLTLPDGLGIEVERFLDRVLALAQASASARGGALIRAHDLNHALQAVTPHTIDDLEDVTFFPRLSREKSVVLDAFDLDSFRDFGMHWRLIRIMLDMDRVTLTMEPDPFAAELIAEGIAQYSVLLLRMAGRMARAEAGAPFVMGRHLRQAGKEILGLAEAHANTKEEVIPQTASIKSASRMRSDAAGVFMTEVTNESGITFQHRSSDWLNRFRRDLAKAPPTFTGGGVAAGDVNGDGLTDILLVGGIGNALYLGAPGGRFVLSPQNADFQFTGHDGLPGEARQPIIADFDNDGHQDILITFVNLRHRLLRNLGDGGFEDVSERAALGGEGLVAGPATVFDFDQDGLLDIYVCYFGNYLRGYFDEGNGPARKFTGDVPILARDSVNGSPNRLFRNLGGTRFEEVKNSGTEDRGWCQAVSHTDLDGDGSQDLVVANDFGRNALLRNLGDGRFENVTKQFGMTRSYHSMNVGIADLNDDDSPDLYISNINMMVKENRYVLPNERTPVKIGAQELAGAHIVESSVLYMSTRLEGSHRYSENSNLVERSNEVGWAWDAEFFDADNDGDEDLYVLNGANEYFVEFAVRESGDLGLFDWNMEPNVIYVNDAGVLRNRSRGSGLDFAGNSRSAVYLDFDGDGDLDVVINNFHAAAVVFRNDLDESNTNWIRIKLEGRPERGSNRDAIGARILATTSDGRRIWREIHGGSGFLSMEPKVQHFGLGAAPSVDLQIRWPGGQVQDVKDLDANREWLIREGQAPTSGRS